MENSITESSEKNSLKESPLYNLSLSSLENFHTAFLVWLGKNYKKEFLSVFINTFESDSEIIKDILNKQVDEDNIDFESQDKLNKNSIIDINITVFKDTDKETNIFIENKIKAYPTQEQIEKYLKIIRNSKRSELILLTLGEIKSKFNCLKMDYNQLSVELEKSFFEKFIIKNKYHESLIHEYINIIGTISKKFNEELKKNQDGEKGKTKYKLMTAGTKIAGLKELSDVYIKYRGAEFAEYLRDKFKLKNNISSNIVCGFHDKNATIDINILYFNIITFNYDNDNKNDNDIYFRFGIQTQGNQYRHYIICPISLSSTKEKDNIYLLENISTEIKDKDLWFLNMEPNKNKKEIFHNFCGYRSSKNGPPNFIYIYETLDLSSVDYDSLSKKIETDMDKLIKRQDEIKEILMRHIL